MIVDGVKLEVGKYYFVKYNTEKVINGIKLQYQE